MFSPDEWHLKDSWIKQGNRECVVTQTEIEQCAVGEKILTQMK